MSASRNLYSVLGVAPDAPLTVIKAAFRALAKQYHPDGEGAGREDATSKFVELQEAYSVLSDAARRASYDASLSAGDVNDAGSIDEEDISASIDPDEAWNSRVALQPEINFFYETLASYSAALGNRFRLAVIGGECDDNPGQFAADLENSFFRKYFSDDPRIHSLARRLLTSHNRKAARALNKAVQQGKFNSTETYARTYKVFERLCEINKRSGRTQYKEQFSSGAALHSQANRFRANRFLHKSRLTRFGAGVAFVIILLMTSLALFRLSGSSEKENGGSIATTKSSNSPTKFESPSESKRKKQIYDRIVGEQEVEGSETEQQSQYQADPTEEHFVGDAHSVSDLNLCSAALNDARDGWDNRSSVYVSEASGRGLSINGCRLKLDLKPLEANRQNGSVAQVEHLFDGDAKVVGDINLCSGVKVNC